MLSIRDHIKETIKLAIPVSIGQLGHIMMGVVDSIMVGHLGSVQLAAAALVNGLFFLVLVLGLGMSMAITPLVSISVGAGNSTKSGIILRQGLVVNFVFALLLALLIFVGASFLEYLGQPENVTIAAKSYLKILSLSVVPFILFQVYRQFLEGLSDVYPPMKIAIGANIFNAAINYVLIFGKLGFEPLGLDGAGYATSLTRFLMAAILMIIVINSRKYKIYDTSLRFKKLDFSMMRKIIAIGLPSGLQYFFEVAAFTFAAIMIGWLGHIELASHQIAINLASVTYMMVLGISAAGTIRVGNAVGRKSVQEIRRSGFTALGVSAAMMSFFGILFIIFNTTLPKIYISEIEVIELSSKLLIIAAAFQIFDGMQATGLGVLRGLTDVKIPLILLMGSYWILGIPIGTLLGFYFGLKTIGIWIGLLIGLATLAISLLIRFNRKSKKIIKF